MPIINTWFDDEQTIFFTRVNGKWTLDELYTEFEKGIQMIREVDHPVVLIIDLRASSSPPRQFMSAGRRLGSNRPDHLVRIIMVNNDRLMQMLMDVIGKIYASERRPLFFNDADEAIQAATEALARHG